MPQFIYQPQTTLNAILEFSNRRQAVREREEAEREASRQRKKQRLITGVAMGVGGLAGGAAFGGAAATSTTAATGAVGLVGGSVASGAALGMQFGSQIAGDDFAGAAQTAVGAVGRFDFQKRSIETFGSLKTAEEQRDLNRVLANKGILGGASEVQEFRSRNPDLTFNQAANQRLAEIGTKEALAAALEDVAPGMTPEQFAPISEQFGGDNRAAIASLQEEKDAAAAKAHGVKSMMGTTSKLKASLIARAQRMSLEPGFNQADRQDAVRDFQAITKMEQDMINGNMSANDVGQTLVKIGGPQTKSLVPKKRQPPSPKEQVKATTFQTPVIIDGVTTGMQQWHLDPPKGQDLEWTTREGKFHENPALKAGADKRDDVFPFQPDASDFVKPGQMEELINDRIETFAFDHMRDNPPTPTPSRDEMRKRILAEQAQFRSEQDKFTEQVAQDRQIAQGAARAGAAIQKLGPPAQWTPEIAEVAKRHMDAALAAVEQMSEGSDRDKIVRNLLFLEKQRKAAGK